MSKIIQALPATTRIPIGTTDVVIPLKYLKDTRGNYITAMPAGATILYGVLEPESSTKCEIISFTGIQNDGNNQVTLTGVTRNLNPQPPYTALTPNVSHGNNIEFILSNTPPFYNTFVQSDAPTTIQSLWTFLVGARPVLSADADTTDPTSFITYGQLLRTALGSVYVAGNSVKATAGESVTAKQVVYQKPSDGKWYIAKADDLTKLENVQLGIALGSATANNAIPSGVQLNGYYTGLSGLSIGTVYTDNNGNISSTQGTFPYPVGTAISATEIIFDTDTAKRLSYNEKQGLVGAYPTFPSALSPVITKDVLWTDGINAQNLTQNASVVFGQNDATSKRLKIAQSFKATKSTIGTITIKKGTGVDQTMTQLSEATCNTPVYSESDSTTLYADAGVVSGARRITTSGNYWTGADYCLLTKSVTTVVGFIHTLSIDIAGNFGSSGSPNASMTCDIIVDGVTLQTITSGSAGVFSTKTVTFIPSTTATSIQLKLHTNGDGYNQSATAQNYDFKNFIVTYPQPNTGDVTLKVYTDNAGSPSASLIGSITIPNNTFMGTSVDTNIITELVSQITGLVLGATYWLVIESTIPDANKYFALKKNTASSYADGVAKYFNTTDGWVTEAGDLYFDITQSKVGMLPLTDNFGRIPSQFAYGDYFFGDGSDGDVTINANTSLSRDMYYNNLTINNGFILNPNGYRIFVKSVLTTNGTGRIARDGNDGIAGGSGGSALSTGTIGGSGAGGSGGSGGSAGATGSSVTNSISTNASAGNGGAGNGGGNAGSGGSTTLANPTITKPTLPIALSAIELFNLVGVFTGGAGGGGGGSSVQNGGYRSGGGGGSGGGIVMVCARTVVTSATDSISAKGGRGGDGQVSGLGSAGAGGGGNGGAVVLIYKYYFGTLLTAVSACAKGLGGTNGSSAGTAGQDGQLYLYQIN